MNVISREEVRLQDMRAVPARSRRASRMVGIVAACGALSVRAVNLAVVLDQFNNWLAKRRLTKTV